jgi:hypothetical protein
VYSCLKIIQQAALRVIRRLSAIKAKNSEDQLRAIPSQSPSKTRKFRLFKPLTTENASQPIAARSESSLM